MSAHGLQHQNISVFCRYNNCWTEYNGNKPRVGFLIWAARRKETSTLWLVDCTSVLQINVIVWCICNNMCGYKPGQVCYVLWQHQEIWPTVWKRYPTSMTRRMGRVFLDNALSCRTWWNAANTSKNVDLLVRCACFHNYTMEMIYKVFEGFLSHH